MKIKIIIRSHGLIGMMARKAFIFSVFFLLALSGPATLSGEEIELQTPPPARISLDEVLHRALEKNFDIRLARIEQRINLLNIPASRSVYDTLLSSDVNYAYDNYKKSSQYSGDLNKIGNYGLGVSRLLPWGTTLSLEFGNQ